MITRGGIMSRPLQVPAERKARPRPSFECIALVLQGGGALGAYQAGVYEALAEADLHPDWAAGISIGAINAALIAGNPPEARVDKLRAFWEGVTENPWWNLGEEVASLLLRGDGARQWQNQFGASLAFFRGAPRHHVLGRDGAPLVVEVDEIAAPHIDRSDAEPRVA